ncbi:uncharacterized protein BO66DRAFT_392238 [Aspergillus aculeatinus CBS 121060]|uniref:Uncharacterized protein n=1 Tax=Aspergillus aculeatinus CBS 121060 TaxID=1448322 RepID=A0ACD1H7R8_9EURO|nr:hypothetical protein BO66DRAFT_392238 [Aspergillus aculeatinus CBS 121060]RAH69557.1 hypothetical protein BO66DRAFT_392238 [Aspergillus aculeatinus CBS 121060]
MSTLVALRPQGPRGPHQTLQIFTLTFPCSPTTCSGLAYAPGIRVFTSQSDRHKNSLFGSSCRGSISQIMCLVRTTSRYVSDARPHDIPSRLQEAPEPNLN